MAHSVADAEKGRASGWYQAGNLGGGGLGGGLGVWLVDNFSLTIAAAVIAAIMMMCVLALRFVPAIRAPKTANLREKMTDLLLDFRDMLRSPVVVLAIVLILSPIGVGGASYLWSAVAPDWRATPNTVAIVTGLLGALVSAATCVIGGWVADRFGRWPAFFGTGALLATVALIMAGLPRTPETYVFGVVLYASAFGLAMRPIRRSSFMRSDREPPPPSMQFSRRSGTSLSST